MKIGALEIELMANVARLQKDMEEAKRHVSGAMGQIQKMADLAKAALGGLAGALSAGAFASMIKGAIDAADSLNDLSVRTKVAIADLAGLQYAAKMSDGSLEDTAKVVNKLAVEMGRNSEKFAKMGVMARDPLEALIQFADVFAAIEDPQARAALGADVLGKSWEGAAPLLALGGTEIRKLIEQGKELNPITEEMAAKAGEFNDKLDTLSTASAGWVTELAGSLLPMLNAVTSNIGALSGAVSATISAFGPALKIAAAYFAIFVGVPALWAAATAVLTPLGGAVATYAMNVAIGQTATIGFNTTLFGTSVAAQLASGSLSKLMLAGNVLFAAFAGWQIGKYLSEQFVEVRIAGLAFVGALLKGWEHIKYGFEMMGAAVGFAWDNTIGKLRAKFGEFLQTVATGLQAAGFKETGATVSLYAAQLKQTAAAQQTFAQRTAGLTAEHAKAVAAIDQNITEMGQYELSGKKAAKAVKEKAVITAESCGVDQKAAKAVVDLAKAEAEAAAFRSRYSASLKNAYEVYNGATVQAIANAESGAERNERLAATYGMTALAIEQAEIARLEEHLAQRASAGLTLDEIENLEKLIDAKKRNAAALSTLGDKDASAKAATEHARAWEQANAQIGQSLTDALMRGGRSAGEYLKDYFRTLLLRPVIQAIMAPVSSTMAMMMPGTASASTGGAGSLMQTGQSIYSAISGGFSSLSTAVADSVQAVMYQSGMTTQIASNGAFASQIGAAVPLVAAAVASYFGAKAIANGYEVNGVGKALNFLGLAGGVVNRLFGRRDAEMKSFGIEGTLGNGFSGQTYQDMQEKGGVFRSDKNYRTHGAVDSAMAAGLGEAMVAMKRSVTEFASMLGLQADSISGYAKYFTLTLTNDEAKNKEMLASLLSGTADDLARLVLPSIDTLKQAGETVAQTLQRVATNYAAVDEVLRALGMTFGATGVASIEARERLVELSGGVEKLAANAGVFAQEFLTEAERLAPVAAVVAAEMAKLGLSSVDTREEFKAVVQGLDLTSEAGAKQYATLMSLAGAFAQVHPWVEAVTEATSDNSEALQRAKAILDERKTLQDQLDQLTMTAIQLRAKERDAVDESNRGIYDRIQAINDERAAIESAKSFAAGLMGDVDSALSTLQSVIGRQKNAATEAHTAQMKLLDAQIGAQGEVVNKHKALASLLSSTLDNMRVHGGEGAARLEAQAQIRAALAIAKAGGVLPDADTIRKSLGVVSQDASSMFATYQDYARDFYTTQNDVAELGKLTDDALSVEQQTLNALLSQKELAQQMYEAEMKRLDTIVTNAAEQISVLKGQSTTLLNIEQALAGFMGALSAALANPLAAGAGAITGTYQSALGRAPDAAGMAFWQGKLAEGVSQQAINDAIKNSPEAKAQALYQSVLGRAGDAAGIQFWTKQLSAGVSESAIRAAMMGSDEKRMKLPGFAAGGDFGGGLRIVGERGPELEATGASRIWSASQTRSMLGGDSSAVVAEIRALRQTVEQQRAELAEIKRNTRRQADTFDRVTNGGDGMRTVPA